MEECKEKFVLETIDIYKSASALPATVMILRGSFLFLLS